MKWTGSGRIGRALVECEPRIRIVPVCPSSAGPQITRIAAVGGIELDDAQQFLAGATGGVGADGRWAAFEVVIFAPRQNLKSEFLLARILAGLFVFGEELIVYSAHQARTTAAVFRRLKQAIKSSPQLGGRIARESNRSGAELIELGTGQRLECVARSTGSGRGFTGDCVILDEAQALDGEQLAAVLPALSTRPNPQVLYALSMGNEDSSHLGALRARALGRQDRTCAGLSGAWPKMTTSRTGGCGHGATRRTRRGSRWRTWNGSSWRWARSSSRGNGSARATGPRTRRNGSR